MSRPVVSGPIVSGPASLRELFFAFTGLALRGFGGVLPWAHRVLVEERHWLTREDFVELLALSQLLPGPNVVNLSVMVGDRWFGWRGAVVALAGMMLAPAALVLLLAVAYTAFVDLPQLRGALRGMGAVAAGLVIATGLKLAVPLRGRPVAMLLASVAFACVGLARWPLPWVLAVLAPVAIALAWRHEGRRRGDAPGNGS